MTKLNVILNDKTILNFSYLTVLLKRYLLISILTPLIVITGSVAYYLSQNDMQLASSSFEYSPNSGNTATEAIGELLGQQTNRLTPDEILTIGINPEFISGLAARVFEDEKFSTLNFNSTRSKDEKTFDDFFGHCQAERDCILRSLRSKLPGFYSINFDERFKHRFILSVTTLDRVTSNVILGHVKDEIVHSRKIGLTSYISTQEKLTKKLMEKQEATLENVNFASLEVEKKSLYADKVHLNSQISSSYNRLSTNKVKMEYMLGKLKVLTGRKKAKKGTLKEESVKVIVSKIDKLKKDIAALESSTINFDKKNNEIIKELRRELKTRQRKLASYGDVSVYSQDVQRFDDGLRKSKRELKLEYNIAKKQYNEIKKDHDELVISKKILEEKIRDVELKIKKYAPEVEYSRKLNNKLVQLQLLNNTVVPDIKFSKDSDFFNTVKRVEKTKVILFTVIFSLFMVLCLVLVRFLLDTRIYDTEELMATFDGLEIIGNTPEFE